MKKGEMIVCPGEVVAVSPGAWITRKALKHLIESRITQKNSWEDICYLLDKVEEVIREPRLTMKNPNQERYPGSLLLANFYEGKKLAVAVILEGGSPGYIITAYFIKKTAFKKLLGKKNGEIE